MEFYENKNLLFCWIIYCESWFTKSFRGSCKTVPPTILSSEKNEGPVSHYCSVSQTFVATVFLGFPKSVWNNLRVCVQMTCLEFLKGRVDHVVRRIWAQDRVQRSSVCGSSDALRVILSFILSLSFSFFFFAWEVFLNTSLTSLCLLTHYHSPPSPFPSQVIFYPQLIEPPNLHLLFTLHTLHHNLLCHPDLPAVSHSKQTTTHWWSQKSQDVSHPSYCLPRLRWRPVSWQREVNHPPNPQPLHLTSWCHLGRSNFLCGQKLFNS